jgi:hypothetical protein
MRIPGIRDNLWVSHCPGKDFSFWV